MKYLLIILITLSACSPVKIKYTGSKKNIYEPYTGAVRVLDSLPENKKYVLIGELSAEAYMTNPNDEVVAKLKKEAAKRGANAIVMNEDVATHINIELKNLLSFYDAPKSARATAIRIK